MDKETPKPKIERRDGKIFFKGEKHAYMQGMIRHFYLSAKELCFNRSISHDFDKGVAHASFSLVGKATVDKDSLGIIGNKKIRSRDLSLTLRPWPKDETPEPDEKKSDHKSIRDRHIAERKHGPWRGMVGFIEHDWEIGIPDNWFAEVYLPQPVFDELAAVCRKGSLATLSLGFNSDFWVTDHDEHAPPSVAITWYLARRRVQDCGRNGQTLPYVYGHADQRDAAIGKSLTRDEARRIASQHRQVARLTEDGAALRIIPKPQVTTTFGWLDVSVFGNPVRDTISSTLALPPWWRSSRQGLHGLHYMRPLGRLAALAGCIVALMGVSNASDKIALTCSGTAREVLNLKADSYGPDSLVIDLDRQTVTWANTTLPIVENKENVISFENKLEDENRKEDGDWISGYVDRVVGTAFISEHRYRNYGLSNGEFQYDLSCKRTSPLF